MIQVGESIEVVSGSITFIALALQIVGMIFFIATDYYADKFRKKILNVIALLIFTIIIQNYIEYYLIEYKAMPTLRTVVAIYGYSVRPIILVCYFYVVSPKQKHLLPWAIVVANFLVHITALFSHITFWIDENNRYQGGPLAIFSYTASFALIVLFLYTLYKERITQKENILYPLVLIFVIMLGIFADIFLNQKEQCVDFVTIAMVSASLFFYIWLFRTFVKEHERDILQGQRAKLMLSQIQPHFINNSLSSIAALCEIDPKKAQELTCDLADYLRINFTALTDDKLIPFDRQLEQVEFYLKIEKARFGDRVNVIYDIQAKDFSIPTLSVQPLVENAVRHGLCKKEGGGTIIIKSYEEKEYFYIKIIDDGAGFDTKTLQQDDSRSHVGLENVRTRLNYIGAKLDINSDIGKGTSIIITIPKNIGGARDESYRSR